MEPALPFDRPWFTPLLAGATLGDRLLACVGALVGIAAVAGATMLAGLATPGLPLLVAPIGASAVLAFAVPASPLAQPWSIIGGNTLSALVGVAVAMLVPAPPLAAGLAVAAAILVMSLAHCLHPPGGAVALLAALGGPAVTALGFGFAFAPVAVSSAALVGAAWLFHRLSRHAYPHRPNAAVAERQLAEEGLLPVDIERAVADLGETFDIGTEDLAMLVARAEHHAAERRAARPALKRPA
ncbi:HPP family protein [Sphingoaurantiacus capsulatus]|uniref:HPP family protein n=1 Tax=Sphingoaurantiacus capsulatus TaxID=1771310 RepID=A0ABV7XCQ5_9SPHN